MTPPSAIPEAALLQALARKGVRQVDALYEGLGDRHECVHFGFLDGGGRLMGDPLALLPENMTARLLTLLEESLPARFGFEPDGATCRLTLNLPAGQVRFCYRAKQISFQEVPIQGGPLGRPGVPG